MWEPRPGHEPPGARLEGAAEALVLLPEPVDLLDHRRRRVGVEAADRVVVDAVEVGGPEVVGRRRLDAGDPGHVAADRHADRLEELAGEAAGGDAGRRLAGAGPLEHVARVLEAVLEEPREVGVAGARQVDLLDPLPALPRTHPLDPVLVVAVGDEQRDRAAERPAVADAGADLGGVLLDLHPAAAPVAELAPRHVAVERLAVELEPRGHALDDRRQSGAVGLTGGYEIEAGHRG